MISMKVKELQILYYELLAIIEIYGKKRIEPQIERIKDIVELLNEIDIRDERICRNVLKDIIKNNIFLYPLRGGLSDFSIIINDKTKERLLNEQLEDIQNKIDKILRSV